MVESYPAPLETIPVFGRGGSVIPVVMETPGEVPTAEGVLATREVLYPITQYSSADS